MMEFFDRIVVESGSDHYAEPFDENSFLKMPLNALVNFGYVIVGLLWLPYCARFGSTSSWGKFFCFLAVVYGPVQFLRIVTQYRFWGIVDQWITLPFFATVVAWNLRILKTSTLWCILVVVAATASYGFSVIYVTGFEVALGVQIVLVVVSCVLVIRRPSSPRGLASALIVGLFWCAGFVVLKVYDHAVTDFLASFLTTRHVSGHFLSKICDFMQIHAALSYFVLATKHSKSTKSQ
eukprot:TRINITY_DN5210_c0_g2_i1.p1 TRINITY_DN5210_c0_g2~~TRINITY_DN5210_c0_g2_i1.p1  ORF type:complete len:236 (+),score=9.55 TRINITY_DN5210_c0_g2_i1:25-732(+)